MTLDRRTITFHREPPKRSYRRLPKPLILSVIEEANYDYHRIDEIVERRIQRLQDLIKSIKEMTEGDFIRWVSQSLFGVALKSYYIAKYEKLIEAYKGVKASIDYYTELYVENPKMLGILLKQRRDYKGWIRELKEAIRRVARTRYNLKISQFLND